MKKLFLLTVGAAAAVAVLPFVPALAIGFIAIAAVSVIFERLLYSRLYRAAELDQVLFTIGLVFVMIAAVTLAVGPETQPLTLPAARSFASRPSRIAVLLRSRPPTARDRSSR